MRLGEHRVCCGVRWCVLTSAVQWLTCRAAAAAAGRFIDGYTLRNYTLKGLILQVRGCRTRVFIVLCVQQQLVAIMLLRVVPFAVHCGEGDAACMCQANVACVGRPEAVCVMYVMTCCFSCAVTADYAPEHTEALFVILLLCCCWLVGNPPLMVVRVDLLYVCPPC
jgi:hypothetical protein